MNSNDLITSCRIIIITDPPPLSTLYSLFIMTGFDYLLERKNHRQKIQTGIEVKKKAIAVGDDRLLFSISRRVSSVGGPKSSIYYTSVSHIAYNKLLSS